MQFRIERSNSDSGRIKIVRLQTPGVRTSRFKPLVRAPVPAIRAASEPLNRPDVAPPSPEEVEDSSPAARARRATRRLRRHFDKAKRAAKRQARLHRRDEYALLECAYRAVRSWRQDGVAEDVERELRAEAEVAMSRASSLFLVLVRSALPRLDAKRSSKWAAALQFADHQKVRSKRLVAFLHNSGGIEGAARESAK